MTRLKAAVRRLLGPFANLFGFDIAPQYNYSKTTMTEKPTKANSSNADGASSLTATPAAPAAEHDAHPSRNPSTPFAHHGHGHGHGQSTADLKERQQRRALHHAKKLRRRAEKKEQLRLAKEHRKQERERRRAEEADLRAAAADPTRYLSLMTVKLGEDGRLMVVEERSSDDPRYREGATGKIGRVVAKVRGLGGGRR